ncbi:hypothetical protein T484DRAFT_1855868 [Baffinella frigidus]|nr:hypothetical protein T484DRAFT_1855868 [Cryptophyta sp. CCMP2293]
MESEAGGGGGDQGRGRRPVLLLAVLATAVVAAVSVSSGGLEARGGQAALLQGSAQRVLHALHKHQAAGGQAAAGKAGKPAFKCYVVDGKPHCASSASAALAQAEEQPPGTPPPVQMRAIKRERLGEIEDKLARTRSEAQDLVTQSVKGTEAA